MFEGDITASHRDPHRKAKEFVRDHCKGNLGVSDVDWAAASLPAKSYNCFGFAMGLIEGTFRWWEPKSFLNGKLTNPLDY
jgi:hypothetical protein